MKLLENKWALVTGSSRGIGQQITIGIVHRKCNQLVHAQTVAHGAQTLQLLQSYGIQTHMVSGDLDISQLVPYSISKAAVDKYTCDRAAELHGINVPVNYLDPGWVKTDLGGPNADNEAETVLPGASVPALLEDNGPSGRFFAAQGRKVLER
jgi:NAD(P)-dependent dehydrogenase (short-subunit alcohol dehydrogenase family)